MLKPMSPCSALPLPKSFCLAQIFSCGQAFRFTEIEDGVFAGVAFSRFIAFQQKGNTLSLYGATQEEANTIWHPFFDLDRDYESLQEKFSSDPVLKEATAFGYGIRILKQDFFEMMITFILSQQNNIPRISKLVEALCTQYGTPLTKSSPSVYSFPSPKALKQASEEDLRALGCGFRAPYLLAAVDAFINCPNLFSLLSSLPIQEARKELMKIKGIGPKVADCILLFGLARFDAFPVDVWMKRAISLLYEKETFDPSVFGPFCGIAQQYLFYYARSSQLGRS